MTTKTFNKLTGNTGETAAVDYLRKNGFEILARNYTAKHGEIDIIAKRGEQIHFIEVKTRAGGDFGGGRAAVNYAKRKTIRSIATIYLVKNGLYDRTGAQFDVIEITGTGSGARIEYLPNCF